MTTQLVPSSPEAGATAAALIVAIAEHADRQAFVTLFDHFAPRVKSLLMRRGLPAGLAEEIAQETMLTLWRRAACFSAKGDDAGIWIFTIARNLAVERRRDPGEEADMRPSPDDMIIVAEGDARLREAFDLPSAKQAGIAPSLFQGMAPADIAGRRSIDPRALRPCIPLPALRLRAVSDDPA